MTHAAIGAGESCRNSKTCYSDCSATVTLKCLIPQESIKDIRWT